jgi:hypothetical protein
MRVLPVRMALLAGALLGALPAAAQRFVDELAPG